MSNTQSDPQQTGRTDADEHRGEGRCWCGRAHNADEHYPPYDPNHPNYRPHIWALAVEVVDARHGYSIEFAASPEGHRCEWEEEYERLAAQTCSACGVLRKNCLLDGQWYAVCPMGLGSGHAWEPAMSDFGRGQSGD
jgi:hypothetical protein